MTERRKALPLTIWAAVVAALLVGLCLRLYLLGAQELWGDEAMTTCMTAAPLSQVLAPRVDVHPPLYYLILRMWAPLVGQSLFALRFASVVFGLAMVALAYPLGYALGGRRVGAVAAWLLALSPLEAYYAQELRMYSLVGALAMVSMLCLVRLLRARAPRTGVWLVLWASALAAMYSHYQAFAVIAGQNVVALGFWLRGQRRRLLTWLGGMLALAVAYLPWVFAQMRYLSGLSSGQPYGLSVRRLALIVRQGLESYVVGITAVPRLAGPATALALIVAGLGLWSLRRRRESWLVPLAWLAGSLVVWWLADPLMPFFYPRFVLAGAPALLLLVAAGVAWLLGRTRAGGVALALVLVAVPVLSVQRWYTDPAYRKGDYGQTMAEVAERAQPGDIILLNNKDQLCLFDYYRPQGMPWALVSADDTLNAERTDTAMTRLTEGHARVWLVTFGHIEVCDPERYVEQWLTSHGYCADYQSHQGFYLNLYILGQPPEAPSVPLEAGFGGTIGLVGYDLRPQPVPQGGSLLVTLYWRAAETPRADYTVFAQLLDANGALVAQFDGQPANGARPTGSWQPGELIVDSRAISVEGVPPGTYSLWVGLYTWPDLTRLPVSAGSEGDSLQVSEVTVR